MSERALRILLLDASASDAESVERELTRAGLNAITERADSEVTFGNAVRDFAPDVVLSDHAQSEFNAPAALRMLRDIRPRAPMIIVANGLDDELSTIAALRAGAADFVLKSNLGRLVPAIRAALSVRSPLEKLSPRQLEVLRLVADGKTNREIATHLQVSAKTIETHRGEVMKRLGIHDVVALVRYAVRVGLVPPDM